MFTSSFLESNFRGNTAFNDIKDTNLKLMVDNMLKNNRQLTQRLNIERNKNYDLMENKRRMEEDIQRLQFELQRIQTNQMLVHRESQVKNNQILQQNSKLKIQLNEYYEENKRIRAEMSKWLNQCEQALKQKDDLTSQNVILINQISLLKQELSQAQEEIKQLNKQNNQLKANSQNRPTSLHNIVTVKSTKQSNDSHVYFSPPQSPVGMIYERGDKLNKRQDLSTNPSQGKLSFNSPLGVKNNAFPLTEAEKMYENFYGEHLQSSPRNYSNRTIQNHFNFISPKKSQLQNQNIYSNQSPSVFMYSSEYSPMIEKLKIDREKNPQQQFTNEMMLKTFQKNSIKDEVTILRNQLVQDLVTRYYRLSLGRAEEQKSNSLKIFIGEVSPKIEILNEMVNNYLQARAMLVERCPTLRLKWQPLDPNSNNSGIGDFGSNSQLMIKNTYNIFNLYNSIKLNAKKQKTVAGQYLALFRYLTLLYKTQNDIDSGLLDCIKHSTLKQIHRIKAISDGEDNTTQGYEDE